MTLLRFAQSLGGCSLASLSRWGMLPCFAQSLGGRSLTSLSCWGDAPSLRSVAGGMLPRFAQLLGGRSLASLSRWGDAPSLRSVAGGCSLASLSRWGDAPSLRSVTGGMLPRVAQSLGRRSLALLSRFPFNGSIKLLQNLHSRGSMKQHFYVWEPHCGYLHKVNRANGAINMHSKGSNESLPKY